MTLPLVPRAAARLLLAIALTMLVAGAPCAEEFTAGRHYELVTPAQPTSTDGKIEVVELFWYGCPHCYTFEPHIEKWLETKPEYIEFVRIPAVFARNWEIHARAYYAAEQLGVLDRIHSALFHALHEKQRRIFTEEALQAFFAEHGVSAADFRTAYDSFSVDTKTRQAVAATRDYGISGVPAVIVNGKYRSSARSAGNYDRLLKLVEHLAAKEHTR